MNTSIAQLMKDIVLETLWPERCACCEEYGELLCDECALNLSYIDACNACPVCGSAFGRVQCCDCSPTMLGPLGLKAPPYDACISAVQLDEHTGRMVALYKDAGEQGLAQVMARIMANVTPPEWTKGGTAVSYVPASTKALRRRGWDHAERLAKHYARAMDLPLLPLFARPVTLDQRTLTRRERFANMARAVQFGGVARAQQLDPTPDFPTRIILVDDVYTTGSTLFAATRRIKDAAPNTRVFCVTFARA